MPKNPEEIATLTITLGHKFSTHVWRALRKKKNQIFHNGKKSILFILFGFFGCNEAVFDIKSPRSGKKQLSIQIMIYDVSLLHYGSGGSFTVIERIVNR